VELVIAMKEISNFMFILIVLVTLYVFIDTYSASAIEQGSAFNSDHNLLTYGPSQENIYIEHNAKTAFISLAPQKLLVILVGLLVVIGITYLLTGQSKNKF